MSESQHSIKVWKGRGAVSALPNRFESLGREAFDDGWEAAPVEDPQAPPATEVRWEDARSALVRNDSPDIAFDYAVNPYRGCEHGCTYCYARPTHSYLGLSPGLDFERVIIAKRGLAGLLRQELARPSYQPSMIVLGSATDCYQPVERRLRLTRALIEVLRDARHPFSMVTKSSGVERDLDLIAPMAAQGLAAVYVTLTTLDERLARQLEPRAASPLRRLRTIRTLAEAGVPVGVSVAPQIPFLNEDMAQVLAAAAEAGARSAFYSVLRLPWELNDVFQQWLAAHYPQRAARVMARIRDLRGGQDYDSRFGQRMYGQGLWSQLIRQRFEQACARHELNWVRHSLDLSQFRPGLSAGQGHLF